MAPTSLFTSCFPAPVLRRLVFSVGPKPLNNFRMIERHYFKVRLCLHSVGHPSHRPNPLLTGCSHFTCSSPEPLRLHHRPQGRLLRSYDFNFGFVIPNSTNSWEAVYPVPPLSDEECAPGSQGPSAPPPNTRLTPAPYIPSRIAHSLLHLPRLSEQVNTRPEFAV